MAYIPDPTDPTRPVDTDIAETAALEFRNLKAYIATLAGLGGGMNLFRRNAIIGGDFSTNPWQRGVTFAAIATDTYSADRWKWTNSSAAVVTISKEANAPLAANAGLLTNHCLKVDVTTADAAVGVNDFAQVYQSVEGYNFAEMLAQRTVSISFWHAHTKVGTYCIAFTNRNNASYIVEYTQLVADAWEYSSIQVPASPIAGTWNYTTGIGIQVVFSFMAGANYQGAAGAWLTATAFATVNQVNAMDDVANNCRIALVQCEGSGASTPFENVHVGDVLERCQRYYEKSFQIATAPATNVGNSTGEYQWPAQKAGVAANYFCLPFRVRKRATPTMIYYAPAAANNFMYDISVASAMNPTANYDVTETRAVINATGAGGTAVGDYCCVHWTADADL